MKIKRKFETAYTTYTEEKIIGNGGTSQVFEVLDDDGQVWAAKLLNINNNVKSEVTKRFKNEIHFCLKNKHKNIVRIVDSGILLEGENKYPFYIMHRYESSLRSIIENGINSQKYLKYVNQILDGIEAAHLFGAIHRDIKPENILYDSKNDNLVIADFGIAAFNEEQLFTLVETKNGTRLANFQYASPEQKMRGRIIDKRTDIYSLGIVINEMATKELAFGTAYKEIKSIYKEYEYLDEIIKKMICQNPIERYSSIDEIKMDIIGKYAEYVQLQRLTEEKSKVISFSEIDDPLMIKQNKIISFDWNDNTLILNLEMPVTSKWVLAFQHIGSYTSVSGKGPEMFSFSGNKASINVGERDVQRVIDYFKQWLPLVHMGYVRMISDERKEEEKRIIEEQKKRIQKEETRLKLLSSIKI